MLQSDKELITSSKRLSAPIITAAQMILSKQFEDVLKGAGFQDVGSSLTMSFEIERHRFIQVHHESQGHWITITNVGTENPEIVRVYDSLYSSCSPSIQQQIACMVNTAKPAITLEFIDVHRQKGSNDCGVFAVAYAVSLCLNEEPGNLSFNLQPALRQHLIQCVEAGEFTSFPVLNRKRHEGFKVNSRQLVKVYCTCRLPRLAEIPMICCSNCHEWYHGEVCVAAIPKSAWNQRKEKLFCPVCKSQN